jgi:hypothetical protein
MTHRLWSASLPALAVALTFACATGNDGPTPPAAGLGGGSANLGGGAATGARGGVAAGGTGAASSGGSPPTDCTLPTAAIIGNAAGDPASIANNLVDTSGWVTGNGFGIQGAFYAYGDGVQCTPPAGNPCDQRGCHVAGNIVEDSTYAAWGCGLGLQLDATCDGALHAYSGGATCFDITLAGNTDGAAVRIGFTQAAEMGDLVAPFYPIGSFTNGWTGTVCLADAICPTWAVEQGCVTTTTPYAIQIQIVGGENNGIADIALVGLVPHEGGGSGSGGAPGAGGTPGTGGGDPVPVVNCPSTSGASQFGSTCDRLGEVYSSGNTYMVQNNIWNTQGSSQCVAGTAHGSYVGLEVTSANHTVTSNEPAAYPSIVKGWHWGFKTSGHEMGRQLSTIGSIDSLMCFSPPTSGKFNVSYDMWLHPTNGSLGNQDPTGGVEMMVWLYREGDVWPIGDAVDRFQYQGAWWRVSEGTAGTWSVISYMRESNVTSAALDLKYFMDDAMTRAAISKKISGSWYLLGIEAGYEIWQGGQGARIDSYEVDVN